MEEEVILWVVGLCYVDENGEHNSKWSFEGVFDTEQLAVERCTDWNHWVGPCKLNEFVGGVHEERYWPDAYYPVAEREDYDTNIVE